MSNAGRGNRSPAFEVDFATCESGSQCAKVDLNVRKWILNCEINLRNFCKSPCNVRNWDICANSFSSDIFVSKFPFSPCIQPLM